MARRSQNSNPRAPRSVFRRRVRTAIHRVSWAYLVLLLAFWEYMRLRGDRSWLGTVILFGPVWAASVPAAILAPIALCFDRRSLRVLAVATLVAIFPIMGFCLPWRPVLHRSGGGQHLRLLTCNGGGTSLNANMLARVVDETRPDIVLLQECTIYHKPAFIDGSWHYSSEGELTIASRFPITRVEDFGEPQWSEWGGSIIRYDIAAPGGALHVFNIHLASPHLQFQAIIDGKPNASHRLENHLAVRREQSQKVTRLAGQFGGAAIIAGDFNSVAEGSIFRQNWSGFADGFTVAGTGLGRTYFGEGAAVRIDHILAGSDWRFERCWVGPDVGSPHHPVIADLERVK